MEYRVERDTIGEIEVPAERLWGAQTERSRRNFNIGRGKEEMPEEIIKAFAILKLSAARANRTLCPEKMTEQKLALIERAAEEIKCGKLTEEFPLVVFQTGSGTQTNMNVNEVIAGYANREAGEKILHPNDDVNMSQSSNDTFPTAMHIAALTSINTRLVPATKALIDTLLRLERENEGIIKCGRTHLQDATPISFSQEISGWRASLEYDLEAILSTSKALSRLALGGTAVGTGLNAPEGFDRLVAEEISRECGTKFVTDENKFHALTSKSELQTVHGAIKALSCDLMKIANDVRWLASGPRLGLGEIFIPENEPGSSIMPGKVNPTQCEALTMVALQVMANDVAVGFSAASGNFELNVYMPVCIYNFLQSVRLLSDAINSFNENCASGIKPNREKMEENLENSLMLVTALSPYIGYERSAEVAKLAYKEGITLKEAVVRLGYLEEDKFDEIVRPEKMV